MPNRPPAPTYLEAIANEIIAKYRKLDSIVTHAPTKGTYHEKILRDMIRSYLTSTYSTGEGFIINYDGEISSQLDILVVDNMDPRSFGYKEKDFYIASATAAVCIGEVKSYATKKDFIASFHKIVNAKLLIKESPARVASFMFCYDARASQISFRAWVDEAMGQLVNNERVTSGHCPDYIFCLNKGILLKKVKMDNGVQYDAKVAKNNSYTLIQQLIMQELFQCITNGCCWIRAHQGIKMFEYPNTELEK